jgi:hypothetical protein
MFHPSGTTGSRSAIGHWLALDFDGQPARVIAVSLFAVQVVLFLIGRAVDWAVGGPRAYGFFVAMLIYACLVGLDALSVRMPLRRAAFWAAVVTFGLIFGAIPYARRRQHLRRGGVVS